MFNSARRAFYRLTDAIGESAYRRAYGKRLRVQPTPEQTAERRAANARYFDVDEDHCVCPKACDVHP